MDPELNVTAPVPNDSMLAPGDRVPLTVTLPVKAPVPPSVAPAAIVMLPEPVALPAVLFASSVPPLKVLAPDRANTLAPVFVRLPVPVIALVIVNVVFA